ncbi:hypothetical protein scyTo_0020539 [Scyliorhinus torazame]|uniref:Uncharacterized protein n=1 Tax=Scyliorhinus torazame TaxID=75743 RepID=A0A401PVA9_SCYTO|nr:hypothetical protein [Scyliorhinus torazame]
MKRMDDANVPVVVDHQQVGEEREEDEVREGVKEEADLEGKPTLQAHPGEGGEDEACPQVRQQQAQQVVVGGTVQPPVADDARDDDQVAHDDDAGERS